MAVIVHHRGSSVFYLVSSDLFLKSKTFQLQCSAEYQRATVVVLRGRRIPAITPPPAPAPITPIPDFDKRDLNLAVLLNLIMFQTDLIFYGPFYLI